VGVSEARLFEVESIPGEEPRRKLSATQRLTIRRKRLLDIGIHPVTRCPLLHAEWNRTCGDCDHHVISGGHARPYHKCRLNISSGPATDIRVSWPACQRFQEST
jgi:hypothetical protein